MDIPKGLTLKSVSGSFLPHATVHFGEQSGYIQRSRWVQFLALLAYRHIVGSNNGWVTLDDLQHLLAFRGRSPTEIGKYLFNSASTFPPPVASFLKQHIALTTTGPFRLEINQSDMEADVDQLRQYLDWVFMPAPAKITFWDELRETARQAMSVYEFNSAHLILTYYLKRLTSESPHHYSEIILTHINLATIEYLTNGNKGHEFVWLKKAEKVAGKLRLSQERRILLSYILGTRAWMTQASEYSDRRTIKLNQSAIDLAEELPRNNPDRACLLAERYYHRYYTAVRYDIKQMAEGDLEKATGLFQWMNSDIKPKFMRVDSDVSKFIPLQVDLLQRLKGRSKSYNDPIAQLVALVGDQTVDKLYTLSAVEWIAHGLKQIGHEDEARAFIMEALIAHAPLHQTELYRRLMSLRQGLP